MNKFLTMAALLLMTVFSINANAQKISDDDQKGIEKVYADFMSAFEKMDAQATANLYTENGVHIDPTGKITRGRKDLLAFHANLFGYFKSLPKPDKITHNDTDWNTRYIAPGIVLVTYTSEDVNYYGDKTRSDKFSLAVILKKTGNKWLADQVAMTPVTEQPKQ